jgi:uncharacterized protein YbbC (DUF1343 family)
VIRLVSLLVCVFALGCQPAAEAQTGATPETEPLKTGADLLRESGFAAFDGLRVGLIANQTSVSGGEHLADLLHAQPGVQLAALFGPEHGLRGDADAGAKVEDGVDDRTGAPVYSLYGSRREPDPEVLENIDVLVFDIQDIGARFYTYIATMGRSMEAAARAGVSFVVLDRPNPLGGLTVDGYVLEPEFESFVGPWPIPVQHGLTVGELALMIKGEGWIDGAEALDLHVVEVQGWSRDQLWAKEDSWVPTSPNIPRFENALVYPGMCLLEAAEINEGRGTDNPFLQFGVPGLDADRVADSLNRNVAGIAATALNYTPRSIPGKSTNPRLRDTEVSGVSLAVTDPVQLRPMALGVRVLVELVAQMGPDVLRESNMSRLAGTERLFEALIRGDSAEAILNSWEAEVDAFRALRGPYLLYQ